MSSFSGYILATQVPLTSARALETQDPLSRSAPGLAYVDHAYGIRRWSEFKLRSPIPLMEEIDVTRRNYEYQVFVVRGHTIVIALAFRRRIVDYMLNNLLDKTISPNLRRISISIDKVIDFCSKSESDFLVSSLHGRFAGASRNVKSLSVYGDDVTNSSIYGDNRKLFNFHSCGLGRRLFDGLPRLKPNEEGEISKVSHDGFITLNLTRRRQALELIQVVDFLVRNGWTENATGNAVASLDDYLNEDDT